MNAKKLVDENPIEVVNALDALVAEVVEYNADPNTVTLHHMAAKFIARLSDAGLDIEAPVDPV